MIIDYSTGRIAYHAHILREDGSYFVQYDFDGSVLYEVKVSSYENLSVSETHA